MEDTREPSTLLTLWPLHLFDVSLDHRFAVSVSPERGTGGTLVLSLLRLLRYFHATTRIMSGHTLRVAHARVPENLMECEGFSSL